MRTATTPLLTLLLVVALAPPALSQPRRQADRAPPDCAATQGALPKEWTGEAFAIDGDTLAGAGLKPHIRIWGIQAPELRDQAKVESTAGMRARAALEDLLGLSGNAVSCKVLKFDRYCRLVAQCGVSPNLVPMTAAPDAKPAKTVPMDIGEVMIGFGLAYGFYLDDVLPWDPAASRRYATIERDARKQQRGLWPDWLGSGPVLEPMNTPTQK